MTELSPTVAAGNLITFVSVFVDEATTDLDRVPVLAISPAASFLHSVGRASLSQGQIMVQGHRLSKAP